MPGKHHGKIHLRTGLEHMEGRRRSSSVGADEVGQSSAERLGNCQDEAQARAQPDAQSGAVMLALARADVGSARAGWGADGAQTMQKNLAFSCNDLYLPD